MSKHKSCLVLNADYSPIGIIDWQRAMIWFYRYFNNDKPSIDIVEYHNDDYVMGIDQKFKIPAIIKTTKYFKVNNSTVNFSRKNLFIRDNYTCQYCGYKYHINQLTYDHVIPKCQWKSASSPTTWTNIVTSCRKCNAKKGSKTPAQANMPLITKPYIPQKSPRYLPLYTQLLTISYDIPKSWLFYIE
jgi:hypothetical protein